MFRDFVTSGLTSALAVFLHHALYIRPEQLKLKGRLARLETPAVQSALTEGAALLQAAEPGIDQAAQVGAGKLAYAAVSAIAKKL